MKLSDILGWIKKQPLITGQGANNRNKDVQFCRGFNTALTSCDREIDNNELAYLILEFYETQCADDAMDIPRLADYIISTMPQWMKGVKNEAK